MSCWAPKCPERACHVKFEHLHEGFAYRGTKKDSRMYMPWNKPDNFGKTDRKATKEKKKDSKKYGKLFDWERE